MIIAGFGNPLLDVTVKINGNDLLKKYNLNADDQIEFNEQLMRSLLCEIKSFPTEYTPGGCAQNTLRIFQWVCDSANNTYMIGCIGNDEQAKVLKELVERDGVCTKYITSKEKQTGISIALINQENRSLVANIGASETININNFNKLINSDQFLNDVNLFYMEGFFITKRDEISKYILDNAKTANKLFAFNISAPYICYENAKIVKYFAENCNILFGNMKEYEALVEAINYHSNTLDLALELSKTNINGEWQYKKIIVITNGSKTVTCIHSGGQICEVNVPKIPSNEIKDTTGAGDAFVAGFLFGLFKNYHVEICLKYGCWTARQIIKQVGCKVPNYSPEIEKLS